MTPATIRAAAAHGAHALHEPAHDGEQQIQPQNPCDDPSDHADPSLLVKVHPFRLRVSPRQGQPGQARAGNQAQQEVGIWLRNRPATIRRLSAIVK